MRILLFAILLSSQAYSQEAQPWAALTFHKAPKPLAEGAKTEDWPRFLGAHDDATSGETKVLLKDWPEGGPAKVWEMEKGSGYASPAIADGRLFYHHLVDDKEQVDCLDPETGKRFWTFAYPVKYRDRYGFSNGPRTNPVIDGGRVYTLGVTAQFYCFDVKTGAVVWKRDLMKDYNIPQGFFGTGSTPVIHGDRIIVNVGGKDPIKDGDDGPAEGVCVAAFDKTTGKEVWQVRDTWGASYASPSVGKLRGKDVALVFTGGESRPSHGGLLVIDPASGKVYERFPWRAEKYESVNASTPIFVDDKRVYISECYVIGGVMLEFDEDLKAKPVWKARDFGMHWMTPVQKDGYLYGYQGRNEPDAFLACYDAATGKEMWRDLMRWNIKVQVRGRASERIWGNFRGSLLKVEDAFLSLGELGTLSVLELTPKGVKVREKVDLFQARETWSLPVLSRGLLYICQHSKAMGTGEKPRLICYDLRAE